MPFAQVETDARQQANMKAFDQLTPASSLCVTALWDSGEDRVSSSQPRFLSLN